MFYQMEGVKRDHAYIIVVVASIILGHVTKRIGNATIKKFFSSIAGFAIVALFCGDESVHSIVSVAFGILIMKMWKNQPRLVFLFSFSYRVFFCASPYLGFQRDENTLANGIQLVLTIKLISVAYEISDFIKKKKEMPTEINENSPEEQAKGAVMPLVDEPSSLDILCYMYCFLGIGTGPFFRYRTYHDMIHMPSHVAESLPTKKHIMSKVYTLIALIMVSLFGGNFFNVDYMKSNEFYRERSVLFRFLYVIPIGLIGMARYGVVWLLSECAFASAGLGVYPANSKPKPGCGPTVFRGIDVWNEESECEETEYSFEAAKNVYIVKGFVAQTYAKTFRWWNCSVQWWLAHFVYASDLFPKKLTFLRVGAVALVAAVWHGFKAGYYFSFVAMPYIGFAEHMSLQYFGSRLEPIYKKLFLAVHWFLFKVIGICSFMTTFVLSDYNLIMKYLSSVYFGIYAISGLVILITGMISLGSRINKSVVRGKVPKSD